MIFAFSLSRFAECAKNVERPIPMRPNGGYYHFLSANDYDWRDTFIISKLENITGNWSVETVSEPRGIDGEKMFFMELGSAYYGASTKLPQPLTLQNQTLVVQYEVRLQENLECGGAYIKLFSDENYDEDSVSNETKYSIMFGPDKCGSTDKVHFIFRHKNILSGEIEEKHLQEPPQIKSDQLTHLYTLIVRPDNTFEILIDGQSAKMGSLLTDFKPSVFPSKEIDDPNDTKPADWVDDKQIPDPNATKPADWDEDAPQFIPDPNKTKAPEGWLEDEPKRIPDPNQKKPDDWDDEVLGEWEPQIIDNPKCLQAPGCGKYEVPVIPNPAFRGKWQAPMIDNPAYKGEWKPRQIPNPYYYEDRHPHNFMTITAAGFDLWEVNRMIGFTNIYIGTDEDAVYRWNREHFIPKYRKQDRMNKQITQKKEKEETKATGGLYMQAINFAKKAWACFVTLYVAYPLPTISAVVLLVILNLLFFLIGYKANPDKLVWAIVTYREKTPEEIEKEKKLKEEKEKQEKENEQEKVEEKAENVVEKAEEENKEEKNEEKEVKAPKPKENMRKGTRRADNF